MLKSTELPLEGGIPLKERRGLVTSLGGFPLHPSGILEEALTGAGLWQKSGSVSMLVAGQCITASIIACTHSCGNSCSLGVAHAATCALIGYSEANKGVRLQGWCLALGF